MGDVSLEAPFSLAVGHFQYSSLNQPNIWSLNDFLEVVKAQARLGLGLTKKTKAETC